MTALNKQAGAGDVNPKTYYIHPAAFGSTKDPGYGHVPVVKADDFENLRAKLEAAEKRIAELEARTVTLPDRKSELFWPGDGFEFDNLGYVIAVESAIRAAGIGVKGE
ncbi:accessory factor UbiK family protein [Citrobacter sp. Cpo065]|uniref:hypothetical protein n=1 Tax=Citrobacter sp. Cpo065 TaxID=2985131 RepID=UPI002577F043|nr:hypothetical protein [Citrobacter sp. Cpo065]MDM2855131.1 accessory factor UbiK family protein [Citrobacter sp. Cpo065]